jgi:hypothetical protein
VGFMLGAVVAVARGDASWSRDGSERVRRGRAALWAVARAWRRGLGCSLHMDLA